MPRLSSRRRAHGSLAPFRFVRRYGWVVAGLIMLAVVQAAPIASPALSSVLGTDATSIPWVVPQF